MPFQTFDVFDQALVTDIIKRPPDGRAPGAAEDVQPQLGERIAPLKSHPGRIAKIKVAELQPFGKGQFRAPDASPLLYKPAVEWEERLIRLLLIDEMEALAEEEWLQLNSSDEDTRRAAGASLVDRGRILKLRNERATEWLRWQAFQGGVTVPYDRGQSSLYISYALPAGHNVIVSTPWSDTANSDPVTDVQSWSETIAADTGFYGKILHMNSKTYNYLIQNDNIKNSINFYSSGASNIFRPRNEDILALFTSFFTGIRIELYDNGFREEGETGIGVGSIFKYLPDGYVFMTTDYSIDGVNIADTLDGQVQVPVSFNETAIRQGEQAWTLLEQMSGTHFLRYASARVPRIIIPEAMLWAKVA